MPTFFKIVLLLIGFCISDIACAQVPQSKKDSTDLYQNIKNYSQRNKFTKLMHKLMFRSAKPKKMPEAVIHHENSLEAEGKIIRNINIITLDPFGNSISDTTRKPRNWGERTGNRLHLKTKQLAIKNLLLFKKNTPYDGFKIKESERILRTQKYIRSALITEEILSQNNDSVDVTVRVLDSWSLLPKFSASSSRVTVGFDERNVFGIGHQLKYKFTNRFDDGKNANDVSYFVPNIKNTFVNTGLYYKNDLNNYYSKGISINRPFYSPLAKWGGGIDLKQDFRRDSLQGPDFSYEMQNFKYNSQDYWLGHAFRLFKNQINLDRTTNLIVSGRYLDIDYLESPTLDYDPIDFFSNEKQILVAVGVNTQQFVKDSYIFRYGITEDIPTGRTFSITGGYQHKNNIWRPYIGTELSYGNYFNYGYFSTSFQAGTYFYEGKTYQTAFNLELNYFTNLLELGSWKLRQFVKPELIIGVNRQNSIGDMLNLNDDNGLPAFDTAIYGTSKMMLTLQTQTYSPKELWGFRLNPYFNCSVGILGDDKRSIMKGKVFSKLSLGLLINNDYLVFSSFQLSISYYPSVPYEGGSNFKTNAFETTDFSFPNFALNKPQTVDYN
ncbi:BamA/TamA family outer membrane protein [Flavobacterium agrisoli]|uniref:Uncharacterized protein n=1 Tax=Flavobacterium agrisoli TaxID=2793066 RepID=A0A934PKF3_9FLAO|nr:hypothetical protein [Flavobacterium agrisoli]MBK0368979.1 hypothetical protein [Flavobacterium agrisoli]